MAGKSICAGSELMEFVEASELLPPPAITALLS